MMFPEIGYKVEIIPDESGDCFQPMITLKFGDMYEQFHDMYALATGIRDLSERYPFKTIDWIAVNIHRIIEELKNLELMERYYKPNLKYIY